MNIKYYKRKKKNGIIIIRSVCSNLGSDEQTYTTCRCPVFFPLSFLPPSQIEVNLVNSFNCRHTITIINYNRIIYGLCEIFFHQKWERNQTRKHRHWRKRKNVAKIGLFLRVSSTMSQKISGIKLMFVISSFIFLLHFCSVRTQSETFVLLSHCRIYIVFSLNIPKNVHWLRNCVRVKQHELYNSSQCGKNFLIFRTKTNSLEMGIVIIIL